MNLDACGKNKPSQAGSAGQPPWPDWIRALQESSLLLRRLLDAAEWEPLQQAIRHRESLLRDATEHLGLSTRKLPCLSRFEDDSDIKMALQSALDANTELLGLFQTRRRELKAKIGEMSKGRKLLNLYKTHRQTAPRFFDKFG